MPDLPTLTVTQAQMDEILAAFQDLYGTTTPEATATAYKRFLGKTVKDVVVAYEAKKIDKQRETAIVAMRSQVDNLLGDPNLIV